MAGEPHDEFFHETFSDESQAAAVLRSALSPGLAALFEWDSLRIESGTHAAVGAGKRYADLLFTVRHVHSDHFAFVYVLYEHQSTDDPLMALRLLRHMVRIWDASVSKKRTEPKLPLPAVLPVVLSHAEKGWHAKTRFQELFAAGPSFELLRPFLPDFEYLVDDITKASDEDLAARKLPPTGALSLWALRDGRAERTVLEHAPFWAPVFELLAELPGGQAVVDRLMEYLGRAGGDRSVDLGKLTDIIATHSPKAGKIVMDSVEKLIEKGRQEGLAKGHAKGREEERRAMLLKLMTLKFGDLTPAQTAQVEAAGPTDLERYLERVLTADSVAAVLGG
jgi:hypothetical protein